MWCSCAPFRARRQRRPLQAATKRRPPALVACGDGATSQSLERRCTDVHAHWLPTAATWSRTRLTARWHRSPRARHRITALVCPRPEHKKNGVACFRQTLHLPNCCSRAGAMWAGAMCSCCVRAIGTARALCREELPVPSHRLVDHGCAHAAKQTAARGGSFVCQGGGPDAPGRPHWGVSVFSECGQPRARHGASCPRVLCKR